MPASYQATSYQAKELRTQEPEVSLQTCSGTPLRMGQGCSVVLLSSQRLNW